MIVKMDFVDLKMELFVGKTSNGCGTDRSYQFIYIWENDKRQHSEVWPPSANEQSRTCR